MKVPSVGWEKNYPDYCSNFLSAQILFQNSNFIFRILFQFLESKFLFLADISPFYVMINNSKTNLGSKYCFRL